MMCKVAKFILGCYIILMFKPVMPLLSDMFQHTFNEKQHILLVHEVHGKFHIHQELANAGNQTEQQKSHELKVEVEQYFNIIPAIFKIVLGAYYQGNAYLSYAYHYPVIIYRDIHYPPPKSIAQNKISGAMSVNGNYFGLSTKGILVL